MGLFGRLLGRRTPDWDEVWQTYPGVLADRPAIWAVDLGVLTVAPLASLPVRMDVYADVASGPDGLPVDGAEVATIEDAVRAVVTVAGGAYLGRVASAGSCHFTAQLPELRVQPQNLPGFPAARLSTAYDPHWAYVRDVLAPDDRQDRLIADLAVVGALAGHGDPLAVPREVEHLAYFPIQSAAEQAAADLRADGFAAVVERDDEGEFALTALRRDPVAPPVVHDLTWAVKETVERHGGTYDGWNCALAA